LICFLDFYFQIQRELEVEPKMKVVLFEFIYPLPKFGNFWN
jgi:hypothetical protein